MYKQIVVHPEHREFQRILWRHKISSVRKYRLNTVMYGLACVPFLAVRSLLQLADEGSRYPQNAIALHHNWYVDDIKVHSGANILSDAIALQHELRELCGRVPTTKMGREKILEYRLQQAPHSWESESYARLGLKWHPTGDHFSLDLPARSHRIFTKRHVLAETAQLFDSLGWIASVDPRKDSDPIRLAAAAGLVYLAPINRCVAGSVSSPSSLCSRAFVSTAG